MSVDWKWVADLMIKHVPGSLNERHGCTPIADAINVEIAKAVAAEREACLNIAEECPDPCGATHWIADEIHKRGVP